MTATQNESIQKGFSVETLISDMKAHLGFIVSAESGHGKSFLSFTLVREAMKPEHKTRVIVFSPSTIWNRKFGSGIYLVKIGTADFSPIVDYDKVKVQTIPNTRDSFFLNTDKKYLFKRSEWLKQLLADDSKHLILEIHYLNSRKIKYFVSECLKMVYERMKQTLETNPDYDKHILFVLEECQNSYSTYSLTDDVSLETLTILSQGRTDANCHFLGICQRLAEVSTKVTERLRLISGLQIGANSLAKVRSQIPDELKKVVQELPQRTWLYLDGKTNPLFTIPEYHSRGKPFQLKPQTEQPQPQKRESIINVWLRQKTEKHSTLKTLGSLLRFLFWKSDAFQPKKIEVTKKEVCRICGRKLTESNRATTDRELCFECENDEAHEEGLQF